MFNLVKPLVTPAIKLMLMWGGEGEGEEKEPEIDIKTQKFVKKCCFN